MSQPVEVREKVMAEDFRAEIRPDGTRVLWVRRALLSYHAHCVLAVELALLTEDPAEGMDEHTEA